MQLAFLLIVSALTARGLDASLLVPEETDISLPERYRVNEWCRQLGKDNVLLISIHCNAAGRGDRWLTARGWCAYTTRGNTRADALATSLYTAAQAIAIASSPFIFANEEMAIPAILYSLMMNVVLLIYVGVVRKRQ